MVESLPFIVEPMRLADVDQVVEIEQVVFSLPWSARAFRYEVDENEHSVMLVVRPAPMPNGWLGRWLRSRGRGEAGPVLGYGGIWLLVDEAHVSTIAVHPRWRGQGLGELLLLALLEQSARSGMRQATLEVRVSNHVAQDLYQKYGFDVVSIRRGYYSDNGENAYIMTTPPFATAAFQSNLDRRRAQLRARLRKTHGQQIG